MLAEGVIDSVKRYMTELSRLGVEVKFVSIFGSQTNGRADRYSDIDLVVVSPRFDQERSREDISMLWRLAARVDSRIEPIACGERQWEEDNISAIIDIARRHGVKILAPQSAQDQPDKAARAGR